MDYEQIQVLKNITYHKTMMLQAEICMQGMIAENKQREILGQSMAYLEADFTALIERYGVHHNSVLTVLQEGL